MQLCSIRLIVPLYCKTLNEFIGLFSLGIMTKKKSFFSRKERLIIMILGIPLLL